MQNPYCWNTDCKLDINTRDWFFNHFCNGVAMITDVQLKELEGLSRYVRRIQEVCVSPYGDYGFALEVADDGMRLLASEVENKYIVSAVNLVPSLIERVKSAEVALKAISSEKEKIEGKWYKTLGAQIAGKYFTSLIEGKKG